MVTTTKARRLPGQTQAEGQMDDVFAEVKKLGPLSPCLAKTVGALAIRMRKKPGDVPKDWIDAATTAAASPGPILNGPEDGSRSN